MRPDETAALKLAEEYAAVDPFYLGKPPDPRERQLMALAIRAYRCPDLTKQAIDRLKTSKGTS